MNNKASNKILAFTLAAVMLLGMFTATPPMTAYAVDIGTTNDLNPALAERSENPQPSDSAQALSSPLLAQSTKVWFGGYQWVIIGWDGEGVASEADTATLLYANANTYKPTEMFDNDGTSNTYVDSDLRTAMTSFYNNLSAKEKGYITPRNLEGDSGNITFSGGDYGVNLSSFSAAAIDYYNNAANASQYIGGSPSVQPGNTFDWYAYDSLRRSGDIGSAAYTGSYHPDNVAGSGTTGDNLWPLSVAEASLLDGSIRTYSALWWLRSPGSSGIRAAVVSGNGHVYADGNYVNDSRAIRPAFYLDLSSVIFTSAASGGKSGATVGSGLVGASAPTQNLKLTVEDSGQILEDVALSGGAGTVTLEFSYNNSTATTGTNQYISCVLVNSSGEVEYYGKLEDLGSSASGSVDVPLTGVANGTYTLKLFSEQANGDNLTDFCSTPVEMTVVVTGGNGDIVLDSASITLATPVYNVSSTDASVSAAEYSHTSTSWAETVGSAPLTTSDPFAGSTAYTATIVLTSETGYKFADTIQTSAITLTGGGTVQSATTSGSGNTLTVTVNYPATGAAPAQNTAPTVKSGEETQIGNATPASNDSTTAAVSYTADVSAWFEDADSDPLTYSIVAAGTDVSVGSASISSDTLTYTPSAADASSSKNIVVKANDNTADSTGNVTITITVGAIPPDATYNTPPSFTQHPSLQNITEGGSATFTASANGNPVPTYQWQESTNGTTWNDISDGGVYSDATTNTLTLTDVPLSMDGYQYRCVASNGESPDAESNAAALTVNAAGTPISPGVSTNSISIDLRYGNTASFSVSLGMSADAVTPVADKAGISVANSAIASISATEITTGSAITVTGVSVGNTTITVDYLDSSDTPVASPSSISVNVYRSSSGTSDSGGSSSSDSSSSYTPTYNITTDKQPNLPKTATLSYSGTVKDGRLTFTVTKAMVQAALDKAGTDPDGIALIFKISNTSGYTCQTVVIEESAFDLLKSSGVKYTQADSALFKFRFDSKAINQLDSQTTGAVSVHANPAKLNEAAQKLIGSRPAFDITVQFKKGGTTYNVNDLGSGRMTRWIAYKPASGEDSGNIAAVHVDKNGAPSWIEDSVYDNGWVSWTSGKLSVYGVGYKTSAPSFTDTANHWAKDYIDFAVSRGLISGTGTAAFSPDAAMTRAVFLSALGKLSGSDMSGYTTSSFTDVSNTDPAMPYIEWAVANKIVSGVGDNKFAPDSTITREQMAVMMVNYAKTLNYTLPVAVEAYKFTDADKISAYAKDAVTTVQQAGIIVGKGGGVFDPQGKATRAEGSTIIQRFVELVIDPAFARGWVQNDSGGWMYYGLSTGKLFTGWQDISGKRYYFDKNGVMQAEKWLQIDSKWYYFQTDGTLAVDTKIDGYEVGADGARKE